MKSVFALLFGVFSFGAVAQTYIDYDDGSTYTLEPREEAYVTHEIVFVKREYSSGAVYFSVLSPNVKRDYVETPWDGLQPGSHEWCKQYIPWSEATRLVCRHGSVRAIPMVMENTMKTMMVGKASFD